MSAIYTELGFALDAHKFAAERLAFEADPRQKVVLQSSARRMLLNCTRQWGKSTVCGIKALHRALTIPEALVIVAGPRRAPKRRIPSQDTNAPPRARNQTARRWIQQLVPAAAERLQNSRSTRQDA